MGFLTDVLGLLSSMMLSSVYACLLGHPARDLSALQQSLRHVQPWHRCLFLQDLHIGRRIKKRVLQEKKKKFLQFKTHFSIRQELYWRLSIVRCWQIPHIFHIRPPKTRRCFKTRGTSSTRDSGWPSERGWKWTKYLFFFLFLVFSMIQMQYQQP